jgi:hypothetical protein
MSTHAEIQYRVTCPHCGDHATVMAISAFALRRYLDRACRKCGNTGRDAVRVPPPAPKAAP